MLRNYALLSVQRLNKISQHIKLVVLEKRAPESPTGSIVASDDEGDVQYYEDVESPPPSPCGRQLQVSLDVDGVVVDEDFQLPPSPTDSDLMALRGGSPYGD